MARGNQRDKAREKNLKKKEQEAKGQKKDGTAFRKQQETNAEVMNPDIAMHSCSLTRSR